MFQPIHRALTATLLVVSAAAAQTATYVHPETGIAFDYPASWKLELRESGLVLIPGDLARDASGAQAELLMIALEEDAGIANLSDPRVSKYFEDNLSRMLTGVSVNGPAQPARTALGEGLRLAYKGALQGAPFEAAVHALLLDGDVLGFIHLGHSQSFARRAPQAAAIFASLRKSAPATNPQLTGTWRRGIYTRTSGTSSSGSVSGQTYLYFRFTPDGAFQFQETNRMSGSTADLGVVLGGASSAPVQTGRWRIEGTTLYLDWASGTKEAFTYTIGGGQLRLAAAGRKPLSFDFLGR